MSAYQLIPRWILETTPIVFLGLIIAGGLWLRSLENKARAKEREQRAAAKPPQA